MAKFDVLDMNGKKVSTVELSDAVFGITPNEKVMHAAVVNFLANQRQGTQSKMCIRDRACCARWTSPPPRCGKRVLWGAMQLFRTTRSYFAL